LGYGQTGGGSDVKMSSFEEAFDHFVGERGRRGTKGFHEELIRKEFLIFISTFLHFYS